MTRPMKRRSFLPLLALPAFLFVGAASKKSPSITVDQWSAISEAPALDSNTVAIACKIVNADGSVLTFPMVTTKIGHEAALSVGKEFIYPSAYDLPKMQANGNGNGNAGGFPVAPALPTAFETKLVGDYLTVTPEIRGSLIELTGTLVVRTADVSSRAGGEAYAPITDARGRVVLTENKVVAPEFQQVESIIRICGRPGVEHRIHLNRQKRDVLITVHTVD